MRVLCCNAGSSSLKYALFDVDGTHEREIEQRELSLRPGVKDDASFSAFIEDIRARSIAPDAIAHRIVFGGPDYDAPVRVRPELIATLRQLEPYDALHLAPELDLIELLAEKLPGIPQTVSFDTAFHRQMPAVSRHLPIPRDSDPIVQRYGFHGISYEYIVSELGDDARGRILVAHLGNGASIAALRDGKPIDVTMGFTPLGGLVMGTRPGDLDPGVMLYLLSRYGNDAQRTKDALFNTCGLLGVSGRTADMRELTAASTFDVPAAQAVGLFAYQARKFIGAMSAALGGIDRLVFTGGIGEHSDAIRALICMGLGYLGIALHAERNRAHARVVSPDESHVTVNVIPTNENLVLARHAFALLLSPTNVV